MSEDKIRGMGIDAVWFDPIDPPEGGDKIRSMEGTDAVWVEIPDRSADIIEIMHRTNSDLREEVRRWQLQVCDWQDLHSDAEESIDRLVSACRAMMECAGPSDNWNGNTHDALRLIENAVAVAHGYPTE